MRWVPFVVLACIAMVVASVPTPSAESALLLHAASPSVSPDATIHPALYDEGVSTSRTWQFYEAGTNLAVAFKLAADDPASCSFMLMASSGGDEGDLKTFLFDIETGGLAVAFASGIAYLHTPVLTYAPDGPNQIYYWYLNQTDHMRVMIAAFNLQPPALGEPSATIAFECASPARYLLARATEARPITHRHDGSLVAFSTPLPLGGTGFSIDGKDSFSAESWGWLYLRNEAAGWNTISWAAPSGTTQTSIAPGEWLMLHDGPGDYALTINSIGSGVGPLMGVALAFHAGHARDFGIE